MGAVAVFYLSGHGFGHASRQFEIIRALRRERADVEVVVKTAVPRWFVDRAGLDRCRVETVETDPGVVQRDSLNVDVTRSIDRCEAFHRTLARRAGREARDLTARGARLVVGDIPPLAGAAGARAGVPTVAIGNFTWDWIYAGYPETAVRAPGLVETMAAAYAAGGTAWRLPLHAGFDPFPDVVDVPLVARRATRHHAEIRDRLGLPRDRRLILFAFGRYGIRRLDWSRVGPLTGYHLVVTSREPAFGRPDGPAGTTLDEARLAADGMTYTDLLAAVDAVVTKPGFGMIAECAANDTAMLYTDRGRFPEYAVLTAGMPAMIRAAHIGRGDLFAGRWRDHLDRLLAQPRPPRPDIGGATVIARRLARRL